MNGILKLTIQMILGFITIALIFTKTFWYIMTIPAAFVIGGILYNLIEDYYGSL